MNNLSEQWNKERSRVPEDKLQSGFAEKVEVSFPRNSEICDLGGGQGADAEYFMQHGHNVTLVDLSDVALKLAQKRAQKIGADNKLKVIHAVIGEESLPIKDQSMDVAFSRLVLHFLNKDQAVEVFRELGRILKPNSKAYIAVKSPEDTKEMEFLKSRAAEIAPGVYQDQDNKTQNRFTAEQWKEILTESGITNFEIKSYTEDLSNRGDVLTKSGGSTLILTEIEFTV